MRPAAEMRCHSVEDALAPQGGGRAEPGPCGVALWGGPVGWPCGVALWGGSVGWLCGDGLAPQGGGRAEPQLRSTTATVVGPNRSQCCATGSGSVLYGSLN